MAGLKQGWAFAWRSLMAGELIVIIANKPSLGQSWQFARELSDAEGLMAIMLVILIIGIVVDSLVFGTLERGSAAAGPARQLTRSSRLSPASGGLPRWRRRRSRRAAS